MTGVQTCALPIYLQYFAPALTFLELVPNEFADFIPLLANDKNNGY